MTLKKIIGTGAIAGALGFSAIGLAGAASAARGRSLVRAPFSTHNWSIGAAAAADRVGAGAVSADPAGVAPASSRLR